MRQRGVMGALWRSWGLIGDLCSLELSPGPKWGPGVPSDPLPKPLVNLCLSSHNPAPCRRFLANLLAPFQVLILISVP